ncbi:MAG TPA: hypothetical protein VLI41_10925, partial [Phenylobacterium sp.]|uniref:hypothetical protein n=1 Tax=Phenylobacterium sp. TaxID=1871053 RepID=UPI002CFA5DF2
MRLLIYEPSFRRLEAAIAGASPAIDVVLMDESGALTRGGEPIGIGEAAIEAAWANNDVFMSKAAR